MPRVIIRWRWEEAFNKFGFNDGDGLNFTDAVANYLRENGYAIRTEAWGAHNFMITDILKVGSSVIPAKTKIGYENPRAYLPRQLVQKLDRAFPK